MANKRPISSFLSHLLSQIPNIWTFIKVALRSRVF
jgi:hypothetical protein